MFTTGTERIDEGNATNVVTVLVCFCPSSTTGEAGNKEKREDEKEMRDQSEKLVGEHRNEKRNTDLPN